jgi:hypothetical protein
MKKHISFPSIEQFRTLIANVNRQYNFVGLDDNGEAIYDHTLPKPCLKLIGTVKLHGSNGSFVFNDEEGLWVQSRTNIITPQSDNAGCAFYIESHKEAFMGIINEIKEKYKIDTSIYTICVYFEWCGKGIQKGVGITNLEKSVFIFGIKIAKLGDEEFKNYWVDSAGFRNTENRIYNIEDYKTYTIDIDFNTPQLSQNKIIEMTLEVEACCPVSKAFGYDNTIGEGIVFSLLTPDGKKLMMKSKGEKHSKSSKVTTLKPVDDEKINNIIEVANKVTTGSRLQQMFDLQFDTINGGQIDVKKLGDFIRLVINDVLKEELDVISEAGLEPKDINKYLSQIAKDYFFTKQNESVGLN